jgi:hypothetical protein
MISPSVCFLLGSEGVRDSSPTAGKSLAEPTRVFGFSGMILDPVELALDVVAPVVSTGK